MFPPTPSRKERPAQGPLSPRLRQRAVAPAAVRCVQFSGAWRMGLGDLGHSRSCGRGRIWTGMEADPQLSAQWPQTVTSSESQGRPGLRPCVWPSPPVPGAWRRATLEGRAVGEAEDGHQLPRRPVIWSRDGRTERLRTVDEWACPSLGGAFPTAHVGPSGGALFSGTRTPSPGRSCATLGEVRRQL